MFHRPLLSLVIVVASTVSVSLAQPAAPAVERVPAAPSSAAPADSRVAHTDDAELGAVATVHPLATDAAMDALREGGNAVDAAVAAMLTLGVVDGFNSGIGGGCFMLVRRADGRAFAIDGRETAPALATRDMYLRDGKADPNLSQTGALAVGVPGALAAFEFALSEHGQRTLADAILPAAEIAERGFAISDHYAEKIRSVQAELTEFPAAQEILFRGGEPLAAGDTLVQKNLAATYRAIAEQGLAAFYTGDFAQKVDAWMQANGGVLRAADFAAYRPRGLNPIVSTYRGLTVIGFPPPSSGGLHVAQILAMLERFDLGAMSEADRITALANAMSLAFADRAHWLGDPAFADVPRGLLDAGYLAERSELIATDRAIAAPAHGQPPPLDPEFFAREASKHTTHVSVADTAGNVVSVTATINTTFGAKVVVPGTGVFLNNEMDDFSAQPGAPNAFGLVGAEANAVAPGKRPLSSMSPTIVVDENREPIYALGAAGGPKIITQVVNVLVNLVDLNLPPAEAMSRPRVHHQWKPNALWIEGTPSNAPLRDELTKRGFTLDVAKPVGATNLVVIAGDAMTSVGEPRLTGKAAAE